MIWSFAVKSLVISARFMESQDIRRSSTHHNRMELPREWTELFLKSLVFLQAKMSKVSTIAFKTPNKVWSGEPSNYRARKAIFVGYVDEVSVCLNL